jgi:hypothetical protein
MMNNTLILIFFIACFFGIFWPIGCAILAKLGGWEAVSKSYPYTGEIPQDNQWSFRSLHIRGIGAYRQAVTVALDTTGIYFEMFLLFRLFHPPIFVPWEDVFISEARIFIFPAIKLSFKKAPNTSFHFYRTVFSKKFIQAILAQKP